MASSSSSRAYHTSTESAKRGHRNDGSSRARARERAAETNSPPPSANARRPVTRGSFTSTIVGDKRVTERSHVTETTSRGIRTRSPNRDEKAGSKPGSFSAGAGAAPNRINSPSTQLNVLSSNAAPQIIDEKLTVDINNQFSSVEPGGYSDPPHYCAARISHLCRPSSIPTPYLLFPSRFR